MHSIPSVRNNQKNFVLRNLNEKKLSDIGSFWKKIKPYFSDEGNMSNKITLVDEDKIMRLDKNVAKIMKNYFLNKTKTLEVIKEF